MLDRGFGPYVFSAEMQTLATTSLIHTEVGVDAFGEACEAAGPEKTALARYPPISSFAADKAHVAHTVPEFLNDFIAKSLLAGTSQHRML